MQDIRMHAKNLDAEVVKAFDILVKERTALRAIEHIRGLSDYEGEWRRIVESLEYMKSLADLTATGDARKWKDAIKNGVARSRMSGGIENLWTSEDRNANRGGPAGNASDTSDTPDAKGEEASNTKKEKGFSVKQYSVSNPKQVAYMIEQMLKKSNDEFPSTIDQVDESWVQAIIGQMIMRLLLMESKRTGRTLDSFLTRSSIKSLIPSIEYGLKTLGDKISELYETSDNAKRGPAWSRFMVEIGDSAQKLIDDINSGASTASGNSRNVKYAKKAPENVDSQAQLDEIYKDFMAIKEGERLNKAFSVATGRINKIVTSLYQQANKLNSLVQDPDDKKGAAMILDGMRWMGKISEMLQLRGDEGAREWSKAKRSGLDQLEMAGLKDQNGNGTIDEGDVAGPGSAPQPGAQQTPPQAGTPTGGAPQPPPQGNPPTGGAPQAPPQGSPDAENAVGEFLGMTGNPADLATRLSSISAQLPTTPEERVWFYIAGMIHSGMGVHTTLIMDVVNGSAAAGDDFLQIFDDAFMRAAKKVGTILGNPDSVQYKHLIQWSANPPKDGSALLRDASEMIELLKLRNSGELSAQDVDPGIGGLPAPEGPEQRQLTPGDEAPVQNVNGKEMVPFERNSGPLTLSIVSKLRGQKDIRDVILGMSADELQFFIIHAKRLLIESGMHSINLFATQILQDLGYGAGGEKETTPEEETVKLDMVTETLNVIGHLILGPGAGDGELPDSLLGVIAEVFSVVTDEQLNNKDFATIIAREVANKVMRALQQASSKSASVRESFKRLGIKGNPEDFIK